MKIGTTEPRAVRAGKAFPARLQEKHEGRIVLRETAEYHGNKFGIDVRCTVCGHEWSPRPDKLVCGGHGCPECHRLKKIARAGIMRCPRASAAEKEFANRLRVAGMSYQAIADMLGRSGGAIQCWTNPEALKKNRQRSLERNARNAGNGYHANRVARYRQTEHGKAQSVKSKQKRRALQYHARDRILVDGCWHDVDMWEYITTAADRDRWSFDGADDDVTKRKTQQALLGKISGELYTLDHLVPLNQGGLHHPFNFQNLSHSLNSAKNDSIVSKDVELFCKRLFDI
jgi:transposase